MSYNMEDFRRDYIHEHEDEILEHISVEKRLQSLSVEELKDYLAKLEQQQKQAKDNE